MFVDIICDFGWIPVWVRRGGNNIEFLGYVMDDMKQLEAKIKISIIVS